jgi:hypothetical protein
MTGKRTTVSSRAFDNTALGRRERDREAWRRLGVRHDESGRLVAAERPGLAARVRQLLRG